MGSVSFAAEASRSGDRPGARQGPQLAQLEKQFLEFVGVGVGVVVDKGGGHEFEANAVERSFGGGELGHNLATLGLFVDQALDASYLTLEATEPFEDILVRLGREFHSNTIPPGV